MGSGDERRLQEVVTEVTALAGYDLEELAVRSAGRRRVVRVVVDRDGGVTLDAAAAISRAISERLDVDDDPTGAAPYTLEVTSPGVGRPLTLPRHFRRARTRLVALVTTEGGAVTGHVLGATDTSVRLVLSGRQGISEVEVPYARIDKAKVEVEFSSPPAAVLDLLGVEPAPEPDEPDVDDDVDDDELIDEDHHDDELIDEDHHDDLLDGDDDEQAADAGETAAERDTASGGVSR